MTGTPARAVPTAVPIDRARSGGIAGKRVLVVINSDEGGGVEHLADVLGADLVRRGARVETQFVYPGRGSGTLTKVASLFRAAASLARHHPDIVMTFQPTSTTLAALAGRIGGCRTFIVHQSNLPAQTFAVLRIADRVAGALGLYAANITNSHATELAFAGYPARYLRSTRRIDHGIRLETAGLDRQAVLARYAIPSDRPLLVTAARIDGQKGQCLAIAALARVPRVHYVIAGQGPDRPRLAELARDTGVADRVQFIGQVPHKELMDLYRACDLLVFPSTWETFGLAAVEAAMTGLPIVASDLPALREVLSVDGTTTTTFISERDPGAWGAAINAVLADAGVKGRCAEIARRLSDKYSEERMLRAYGELYAEVVK